MTHSSSKARNGAAAGDYTLTDRLRFGAGIAVTGGTVVSAPEGVTPSGAWTGLGEEGSAENVVAQSALPAGGTHTYRVQVTATVDAEAADASTLTCPAAGSGEAGGFANTAGIAHNDLTDAADACAAPELAPAAPPAGEEPPQVGGGSDGDLPRTGGDIAAMTLLIVLALLLIGGGAVLFVRSRRQLAGEGDEIV